MPDHVIGEQLHHTGYVATLLGIVEPSDDFGVGLSTHDLERSIAADDCFRVRLSDTHTFRHVVMDRADLG